MKGSSISFPMKPIIFGNTSDKLSFTGLNCTPKLDQKATNFKMVCGSEENSKAKMFLIILAIYPAKLTENK